MTVSLGRAGVQRIQINDWLPAPLLNGSHQHWSVYQKKLKAAQIMAWAACKQQGLQPVSGRARLTITLVFSVKRRRDADSLHARVKGILDGMVRGGWLIDDNIDVLDLRVIADVQPGRCSTIIELESVG